jgi:hypothetical protein
MSVARARRRPLLVLAVAACMAAGLSGPLVSGATAAPAPTATKIDRVELTAVAVPQSAPGKPSALVAAGTSFSIKVTFSDGTQDLPASYSKDTTVTFSVADSADFPGSPEQSASLGSKKTLVVPAGQASGSAAGFTLTADNRVRLQAKVTAGSKEAKAFDVAFSADIDVVSSVSKLVDGTADFLSTADQATPCSPTKQAPYCADLLLPNLSVDGARMSYGLCDDFYCGTSRRPLLQVLVGLAGLYPDPANPATVVYRCDKTVCGNVGVTQIPVRVTLSSTDTIAVAPSCTAKGEVNAGADYCVDYKQSTKDNAGDVYIFVLFLKDARVTIG